MSWFHETIAIMYQAIAILYHAMCPLDFLWTSPALLLGVVAGWATRPRPRTDYFSPGVWCLLLTGFGTFGIAALLVTSFVHDILRGQGLIVLTQLWFFVGLFFGMTLWSRNLRRK